MRSRRKNKKTHPLILVGIFLLGILIFIYPIISQIFYDLKSQDTIRDFKASVSEINDKEKERKLELAKAYNRVLDPNKIADPYHSQKEEEAVAEYARMIEVKELIGHIEIPKINQDLPIFAGTSDAVLEKGAGHLEGSSLPIGGDSTHTVITAHRGLSSALMFRELDKLENQDVFFIHTVAGVLAYEVDLIQTIEPDNFKPVLVVAGKDYATLVTCTPYMINSHRLLVRGHRIDYQPALQEQEQAKQKGLDWLSYWMIGAGVTIAIFVLLAILTYRKKPKAKGVDDVIRTIHLK